MTPRREKIVRHSEKGSMATAGSERHSPGIGPWEASEHCACVMPSHWPEAGCGRSQECLKSVAGVEASAVLFKNNARTLKRIKHSAKVPVLRPAAYAILAQ